MSTHEFGIETTVTDSWHIVTVRGDLDIVGAPRVQSVLESVEAGDRGVLVDMTDVSFVDSGGLSVLVGAQSRADEGGYQLRIVAEEPRVLRVLEITGLDVVFTVFPTIDKASE